MNPAGPRRADDLDENVVRLLLLGFRVSEGHLLARAAQHGFIDIRLPHFPILRGINEGYLRMTEIAARTGITKQTAGALALELEELGYIARHSDPQDRRAKVVRFTARGEAFMESFPAILRETEADLAVVLGTDDLDRLAGILQTLAHGAVDAAPQG